MPNSNPANVMVVIYNRNSWAKSFNLTPTFAYGAGFIASDTLVVRTIIRT